MIESSTSTPGPLGLEHMQAPRLQVAQEFYIGHEGSQESYIGDEGPQEFYIGDEGPKSFTLATRLQMILTSARRSFRTGTARALICPATILQSHFLCKKLTGRYGMQAMQAAIFVCVVRP